MSATNPSNDGRVWRRHSFLARNPAHTRAAFSRHYEHHHGPLAAGLAGFRRYASRYVQNHVEDLPDSTEPGFDGVTMTTQVPRADYRVGFFDDPDYEKVKPDEAYLFDIGRTCSVLGWDEVVVDGPPGAGKALVLASEGAFDLRRLRALPGLVRLVVSHLDGRTASRLGFRSGRFDFDRLAEAWFEHGAREEASRLVFDACAARARPLWLPVREVVIYEPASGETRTGA